MDIELNYNLDLNVRHFNSLPDNVHKSNFGNFLYFNAQSLQRKLLDLQHFIDTLKYPIHVILVTETWFVENETQYKNLINYSAFHSTRPSNAGGVSVFIRNDFDTGNVLFEESINNNNILLINLINHQINIAVCYRQPNNRLDFDGSIFLRKLDLLLNVYKKILFFGDFNINLFDDSGESIVDNYNDVVKSNGMAFLNSLSNSFPTRISNWQNSNSCIDHIFTDLHYHRNDLTYNLFYYDHFADHKNLILNVSQEMNINESKKPESYKIINNSHIASSKVLQTLNTDNFDTFIDMIQNIIKLNTVEIKIKSAGKKPFNFAIL